MMNQPFELVRTLSGESAESSTPAESAFKVLSCPGPYVEITFASLSTTGVPTSLVVSLWRNVGGQIDCLGTITIAFADLGKPVPQIFEFGSQNVYCTVSFVGGTSATVSGSIKARPVLGL